MLSGEKFVNWVLFDNNALFGDDGVVFDKNVAYCIFYHNSAQIVSFVNYTNDTKEQICTLLFNASRILYIN